MMKEKIVKVYLQNTVQGWLKRSKEQYFLKAQYCTWSIGEYNQKASSTIDGNVEFEHSQ